MRAEEGAVGRLRWRCRRGTKELDLVLGRFLERGYVSLDADQKCLFEALLDLPDPELQAWFSGSGEPDDPALKSLVRRILGSPGPA